MYYEASGNMLKTPPTSNVVELTRQTFLSKINGSKKHSLGDRCLLPDFHFFILFLA